MTTVKERTGNELKKICIFTGSFWYNAKKAVGLAGKPLDVNSDIHRTGFVNLVRQLKDAIRPDNYMLAVTLLPNVNTTVHMDVAGLMPMLDFVTLAAYDYQTWDRNPYEADYPGKSSELMKL